MNDVETKPRRRATGDQLFGARVPIPECLSDGPVLGLLLGCPVDDLVRLLAHRFFLRRLGSAGGGDSNAVTTYTCGRPSSTISKTTAKCLPVDVQPNTVGRP